MLPWCRARLDPRVVACLTALVVVAGLAGSEPMAAVFAVGVVTVALSARRMRVRCLPVRPAGPAPRELLDQRAPAPPVSRPDAPGRPRPRAPAAA